MSGKAILLVEDNPDDVKLTLRAFKNNNIRNEIVILLSFDLKVGEIRGLLHLCLPAGVMEAAGPGFGQDTRHSRREPTRSEEQWLAENLGRVQLPVTANLRTSLTTRELIGLAPGHVLTLGVPLQSSVEVRVGGLVKFKGYLTTTDGGAAVKIHQTFGRPAVETETTR